ncbi:hypothetical protein E2C01_071810 [Portunus trituberculatus]|uniref:Uncharacterized protein n=1 Tax=Portunus trituberculatus TaxID=210409 RepID=A0A5B7I8Z7_PORTR|nr:hypothetical protein [Portunus trituberculatus]
MKQLLRNLCSLFHTHASHMVRPSASQPARQTERQTASKPLSSSAIYTTLVTFKPAHRQSDSSDPLFSSRQAKVKQE